jgi:hypothetical protein
MKWSTLLTLARRLLDDAFAELEFQCDGGAYYRELASGVIQLVMIGPDARTDDSFQILCGLNSRLICEDRPASSVGVVRGWHLTARGWDCNSGRWPCADETTAFRSLTEIKALVGTLVLPWFQARTNSSSVADDISAEQDGISKAKLYMADGDMGRAREALNVFRRRLGRPMPWMQPARIAALTAEVDSLIETLH